MSMRHAYFFLLLLLSFSIFATDHDNSISGQIIDSVMNEPIYYANIFLANTTIGTTSDSMGHFVLKNIPAGNYSIVVSFIGYELQRQNIQVASGSTIILNFALKKTVLEMEPLEVVDTHDKNWRLLFDTFRTDFLGYTENAASCEFENPEVMHLSTDENGALCGWTLRPLRMKHNNFGYLVDIIVQDFESTDEEVRYIVLPKYMEMTPALDDQRKAWIENRRRSFYGSYRHFFYSLFFGQLEEAGFSLELVRQPKRFRTPEAVFSSENAFGTIFSNTQFALIKRLHFKDYLRVRHHENWARTSFLKMPFDTMQVDIAGNTLADAKIRRSGFWGRIRFADELPLDWLPD